MSAGPAPLHGAPDPQTPGYIVVLHEGADVDAVIAELSRDHGIEPVHVYRSALTGFSAPLADAALAAVRAHPAVKYVEHDGTAQLM
jgi:hypothetical protein